MNKQQKIATIVLRLAQIWGSLSLVFLLFFVGAHLFDNELKSDNFSSTGEVVTFLFFPVSTMIGLLTAYWKKGLGGMITTLGIIGLFILRSDLTNNYYMWILSLPGVLYLASWYLKQKLN